MLVHDVGYILLIIDVIDLRDFMDITDKQVVLYCSAAASVIHDVKAHTDIT